MPIRFPVIVLILSILFGSLIYILHLFHLVTPANEVYARFCALGLFIGCSLLLGCQQARHHRFSWSDVYKNNTFIIVSLTFLLASLFLAPIVSHYAIGLFTLASIIHLLYTRKFYAPPKFFYFLIAFAFLLFFGTIGTQKGFRLPDKILSFYALPFAFCCFRLPKKTLLKIGGIFIKIGIIFFVISILYWFYNFLHLDAKFVEWITGKTNYPAQMIDWERQAKTLDYSWDDALTKDTVVYYPAYFFVNSWSFHYHPTSNSIVFVCGLIISFYLYYKKNEFSTISKWDLWLYIAFCLLTIMLVQSRIGILGFLLVIGITGLYYLKLKTKYFKIGLLAYILLAGACLALLDDEASDFVDDGVRDAYRRIGISYIQEHFWWGCGFEQQRLVLNAQAEKMKDTLPETVYPHTNHPITHVHNQFLGIMVQFGIWGLIALIAMLVAIALYAIKNRSYLMQAFLCFIFFFMLIEEGEYVFILTFTLFFTAISEAGKQYKNSNA